MKTNATPLQTAVGLALVTACCFSPVYAAIHKADVSENGRLSLAEILRVVQFFNSGGYSCDAISEDGFTPSSGDTGCVPHSSDYAPQDWKINLSELLRAVQFFNVGRYRTEKASNDGFAPCTDTELDPHLLPIEDDDDGNFLTTGEEVALGISPESSDPLIGVELALAASEIMNCLYAIEPFPQDRTYFRLLGVYACQACKDPFTNLYIYRNDYEVVDPVNDIQITVPEVALVFLSHGSFSYFKKPCYDMEGDSCIFNDGQTRIDVVALLTALGLVPIQ